MHVKATLGRTPNVSFRDSAVLRCVCLFSSFGVLLHAQPARPVVETSPSYVLGDDDTFGVRVPDAEEFKDKTFRVDNDGDVNLPLLGRVHVAGLTASQLEARITEGLKAYYLQPEVAVAVTEFHSRSVSVLGAVTTPGVQYLRGGERLVDAISRAGGLRTESGRSLTIGRRAAYGSLPLPNAKQDPTRQLTTAEVDLNALLNGENAAVNILLEPHDVVTVTRAEMVYVLGEVIRTGGFVLNTSQGVSVLKALALAGGLSRTAAASSAKILRHDASGGHSQEVAINLTKIMKNRETDVFLQPEDILFVPGSTTKKIANRTLDTAVGMGSSIAVWRSIQ